MVITSTTCIDYARNDKDAIIIVEGIVAVACGNTVIINVAVASIDNTAIIIVDGIAISINVVCNNNTNAGMVNNDRTTFHVTCVDVSSTDNTTTNANNTFISSLVDVTCIDVTHNNKTAICIFNVSSLVAVTCIDVSSINNTTTRDDDTDVISLVDVTRIGVAGNNKAAISIVHVTCVAFNTVPIAEVASYTPL